MSLEEAGLEYHGAHIDMDEIITAHSGNPNTDNNYHWFRLDLSEGEESIADLGGLLVYNSSNSAGEKISGTDFVLVEYPDGSVDNISPLATTKANPNIGVTFTNVSSTGMKIQTTAPFTGTIRYLCSIQG